MRRLILASADGIMSGLAYIGFLKLAGDPVPQRIEMLSALGVGIVTAIFRFGIRRQGGSIERK